MTGPDLTTSFPRSVRDQVHGLVQIGRTIDKGKAVAFGNVGEYHYNCPMDQAVFSFLGIDHEALMNTIKNAKSDDDINAYVKTFIDKKSPDEIRNWNEQWLSHAPEAGSEGAQYVRSMVEAKDPSRTDITTWADMLDLDEGRPVPQRAAA